MFDMTRLKWRLDTGHRTANPTKSLYLIKHKKIVFICQVSE